MPLPFYVSPEQMMQDKAEYARKGITKGKSIIALAGKQGILLVAENPSSSLNKISEIYDRIAFAGAGKYSEFENLRKAGIRYADLKGYSYGREDVTAKSLANAYSQSIGNIFSQEIKPLGDIIVVPGPGPKNLTGPRVDLTGDKEWDQELGQFVEVDHTLHEIVLVTAVRVAHRVGIVLENINLTIDPVLPQLPLSSV